MQLSTEEMAQAAALLADFIGPIAKILVKKTARSSASRRAFIERIADEIESETERRNFLTRLRKLVPSDN